MSKAIAKAKKPVKKATKPVPKKATKPVPKKAIQPVPKKASAKKPSAVKAKPRPAKPPPKARAKAPQQRPANALRFVHVLTMKSRASFEALSPADRSQFEAAGREIFGQNDIDATYAWLEKEEMSVFKLRLLRNDTPECDLWINTAMDDGVFFLPDQAKSNGIGVSQMNVHDMVANRDALCAEIERAVREFKLPKGMRIDDLFWV